MELSHLPCCSSSEASYSSNAQGFSTHQFNPNAKEFNPNYKLTSEIKQRLLASSMPVQSKPVNLVKPFVQERAPVEYAASLKDEDKKPDAKHFIFHHTPDGSIEESGMPRQQKKEEGLAKEEDEEEEEEEEEKEVVVVEQEENNEVEEEELVVVEENRGQQERDPFAKEVPCGFGAKVAPLDWKSRLKHEEEAMLARAMEESLLLAEKKAEKSASLQPKVEKVLRPASSRKERKAEERKILINIERKNADRILKSSTKNITKEVDILAVRNKQDLRRVKNSKRPDQPRYEGPRPGTGEMLTSHNEKVHGKGLKYLNDRKKRDKFRMREHLERILLLKSRSKS